MKKIPLTKGRFAIVDDEDFDFLNKRKWLAVNGTNAIYAGRNQWMNDGKMKTILMHRVILGAKKGQLIDHVNRNPLDNRRENLRFCTASQNTQNRRMQRNNKSGFKGVIWNRRSQKFQANIMLSGKDYYLGLFKTAQAAGLAYARAAKKLHGEFASI